jgi:uncharacterized protein (TIGR00255 family)
MIQSMTGYGKASAGNSNLSIEIEVKSVNSRYLDTALKLPNSLMNKEYELRELIKNKIFRGKVTVIVQLKRQSYGSDIKELDKQKFKGYISLIKEIKKTAKITEKIKLEHLLPNKEIFLNEENDVFEDEFILLKEALEKALSDLVKMKRSEGKELAKDLRVRIKIIEEKLTEIEKEAKESVSEYFGKLKERVKSLLEDTNVNPDRLDLELAVIADKADITEEIVRLKSHLKFFIASLEGESEPGRKLNFLCQEMNRETNTMSSKSISTIITHNTVLIKEEIEKIREQIQNIE